MDITPAMAAEMLQRNTSNRAIKPHRVKYLAQEMTAGRFLETGDSIKFSSTGKLLDGQHRLLAGAQSGITIRTVVACGLPDYVFAVLDSGASRTAADGLVVAGFTNTKTLASAARLTHCITELYAGTPWFALRKLMFSTAQTIEELADGAYEFKGIPVNGPAKRLGLTTGSLTSFIVLGLRAGKTADEINEFISRCDIGNDLAYGDPRLAFRAWAQRSRELPHSVRPSLTVSQLIRTFNAVQEGIEIKLMRTPAIESPFPRFSTSNKEQS
jgi:hypothetical protein